MTANPPFVPHPVLVSPTALSLSLLYAGAARHRRHVTIARSREDFVMRAISAPYAVAIVERGWLGTLDLRRLALRRVFSASPKLVLVLGRDQLATPYERMRFDSIVQARPLFTASATDLQALVAALPPGPIALPGVRADGADQRGFHTSATYLT